MKSILIDENGDLAMEQGSFVWVEEDEELKQSVRILLQTAKEEWFLDEDFGLDRTPLYTKDINLSEVRDSIVEAISNEPRIAAIEKITFLREGRTLFIDLDLRKEDGSAITLEGVNISA